ncbi:hypothetical protein Tsubulata_041877 [Turnera subulata]|uniref:TPX2 central domain-containing protein n=1 Tax=Turnera subulata TaxID=218843 RepID=A0A9Q0J6Y8_9ROSI|nr:hypothetical protein Tsubulata_041877 [Turnera subulata]
MDLDVVKFVREPFCAEDNAIDFDFEFDAPKFYDFTRKESAFDRREAEFWFDTALNYPPSPRFLPFNWRDTNSSSSIYEPEENMNFADESIEPAEQNGHSHMAQATPRATAKSLAKTVICKNHTFMNPTASQLAKQQYPSQVNCERLIRRIKKVEQQDEAKAHLKSTIIPTHFPKRQKLEVGYSIKVARLKHQASFPRKAPKKDGSDSKTAVGKLKVTVPKEPNLETANRAERHRSRNNLEPAENAKSNTRSFRARPLNRKILDPPSLLLSTNRARQQPELKVFHFRTLERAMQRKSVNVKSKRTSQHGTTNSRRALKEKPEAPDKSKSSCHNKKEANSATQKKSLISPPTEAFSKLSLGLEVHSKAKHHPKIPPSNKENEPGPLLLKHEVHYFASPVHIITTANIYLVSYILQ